MAVVLMLTNHQHRGAPPVHRHSRSHSSHTQHRHCSPYFPSHLDIYAHKLICTNQTHLDISHVAFTCFM